MTEYATSIHKLEKPSLLASSPRRKIIYRPTPERPLIVSASELGDFLRCRVRHHWRYQCKLAYPQKNQNQSIGTLGHIVLEHWYKLPFGLRTVAAMARVADKCIKESYKAAKTEMNLTLKDRQLIRAMCIGYAEWTLNKKHEYSDKVIGLGKCEPEEWFDEPLTEDGSIRVRGKLDNRFFPDAYKKTVGLLESKFKGQIRYDATENRLQLSVYLWALSRKYPDMKRYMAFPQILRKQMPGPRVKAALFWRDMVERDRDEVDQWVVDTRHAAMDMLDGAVYPSPMDSCGYMCDFNIPCLLRGNRRDLLHVLKTEFVKLERHNGGTAKQVKN
jgi:hypothetical protein